MYFLNALAAMAGIACGMPLLFLANWLCRKCVLHDARFDSYQQQILKLMKERNDLDEQKVNALQGLVDGHPLRYSKTPPVEPGWYWCRNEGDHSGQMWEAISYVDDLEAGGLVASWMSAPGELSRMQESDWSSDCEWAGPVPRPENTDVFRGKEVDG